MKNYLFANLKLKAWIVCLLFFGFGAVQAQTQVKGVVTSEGEPLPGASVVVKGTSNGTVTDFDGNYEITANSDDKLVISYIGYVKKEVTVAGKSVVNVSLQPDVSALEEVVVIGYGSAKRKDLTGSIVSVKAEELDKVKPVSFEAGLAARASGVQVISSEGGPGAGFKIRVRGGSSINASNDPLYVIDGFAINGAPQGTSIGLGNSSTSPLASIDPSTIESIEILKDASATAIYGSRGANGVVLITTKGGKKGRTEINFETYTGVSTLARKIDLLSAQEFVDWRHEYTPWNPNSSGDDLVGAFRDEFGNDIYLKDPRVILTDWQDEITRTAITNNYKLSMSGGNEKTSYSGSFSYINQEGIIKSSDFERYSSNIRLDQKISDRFKGGINLNFGYTKANGVVSAANENANGRSGIVTNSVLFSPVQGITKYDNAEYDEDGRIVSLRSGDITNPNKNLSENTSLGRSFNSFGNVYLQYEIADGLTFKTSLRGNVYSSKGKAYFSEKFGWGQSANGRAFINNSQGSGITSEQNLNFNKTYGNHRINVTAVYEQQTGDFESINASSTGFDLPGINLDNLQSASVTLPTRSDFTKFSLKSYLGRIQYDFSDRYTLNLSARYDGSSRFAEGSKWGFFPSAGVAWKVSNEKFLVNSKVISNLKLKASYGETGNTAIGSYRSLASAGLSSYIYNGNNLNTGVAIERLANRDLTWETTAQLDAGLSLGLFNNRVSIEADYYEKKTTDLLLEVPLPSTSGFKTAFKNLGSLRNSGFEFTVNTINVDTDDFSWSSNFNISFNENEITDLGGADEFFVRAIGDNQINDDYVVRVGESLGNIYGLQLDDVYTYNDFVEFDGLSDVEATEKIYADAQAAGIPYYSVLYTLKDGVVISSGQPDITRYRPGMPKFTDQLTVDTNGDGIPDEADGIVNTDDRTIIGRTVPKHFGGFTNNFSYKNFDLSILTSWSYGNDVYNKNLKRGTSQAIPFFNKYGIVRDRWTPDNPNSKVPVIRGDLDGGISGNAYSSYVEDGSFFRLSNITAGYNLPKDVLSKFNVKSIRIYGAVDNLYVWTNYSGYDPDVSVGTNQLTPGLDSDSYPRARTFRLGLNVGF